MADAPSCPRCDYSLAGLERPAPARASADPADQRATCPECGLSFTWRELLEPPPWPTWSFEHARSARPLALARALLGTTARALVPGVLWSRLTLGLPLRPLRLVTLAGASLLLGAAGTIVAYNAVAVINVAVDAHVWGTGSFVSVWVRSAHSGWGVVTRPFCLPRQRPSFWGLAPSLGVSAFWALAPAAFILAPTTLRRARVRPRHFARLLASWCLWLPILASVPHVQVLILNLAVTLPWHWLSGTRVVLQENFATICAGFLIGVVWWWWARAAGRYLRLARPWTTTALLLVVAGLATAALTWLLPGTRFVAEELLQELVR